MNTSLRRYLSRQVGDPAAPVCTCCGARRVRVERGGVVVAIACPDCDSVALWTRFP